MGFLSLKTGNRSRDDLVREFLGHMKIIPSKVVYAFFHTTPGSKIIVIACRNENKCCGTERFEGYSYPVLNPTDYLRRMDRSAGQGALRLMVNRCVACADWDRSVPFD